MGFIYYEHVYSNGGINIHLNRNNNTFKFKDPTGEKHIKAEDVVEFMKNYDSKQ